MKRWVADLEEPDWPPGDYYHAGCVCERFDWQGCFCAWFEARPSDWPEDAPWPPL